MIIGYIFSISVIGINANSRTIKRSEKSNIKKYKSQAVNVFCHVKHVAGENRSTVVIISTGFITHYFQEVAEYHIGNNLIRCR